MIYLLLLALALALASLLLSLLYLRTRCQTLTDTPSPSLLILLGSGGHTAEMLQMLDRDAFATCHRTYLVTSGDAFSARKAVEFEERLEARRRLRPLKQRAGNIQQEGQQETLGEPRYTILTLPRARRVHQSLLTAPFTTLSCLCACLSLLASPSYALLLTNGPATAVCVILAARITRLLRAIGLLPGNARAPRTIFVESWARVSSLSLSGRIVLGLGMADRFLVQWEGVRERVWGVWRGKVECRGALV